MSLKRDWLEYFTFTRKERIGSIVLIGLIIFVWFLPPLFKILNPVHQIIAADTSWIAAVKQLEKLPAGKEEEDKNIDPSEPASTAYFNSSGTVLFYFDPNTLSPEGWKKLGIRDKTIQTIKKYLAKGGHFKTPEDLQRVYGLHLDEFNRIKSFVRIDPGKPDSKPSLYPALKNNSHPGQRHQIEIIDINTADTTAFISLPGIGSKLAARIVNFRDKLGGFYTIDQVKEIYGLPDSTFEKIRDMIVLTAASVKKLNINTATMEELKTHPYIRWNLANAIVNYRIQHGNFSNAEDLKNIQLITPELFLKLKPYLTVE